MGVDGKQGYMGQGRQCLENAASIQFLHKSKAALKENVFLKVNNKLKINEAVTKGGDKMVIVFVLSD